MSKNSIRKLIFTLIFICLLVIFFLAARRMIRNNYSDRASLFKNIIKVKYEDVNYLDNSECIYAYNKGEYIVFDLNGNKLYSFKTKKEIVSITKKYYILKDNKYYIYDLSNNLIISGNNAYSISNYLVYVDSNVYNINNKKILFKNVKNVKSYYNNEYFYINNKIVNNKGNILLSNYTVEEVIASNKKIDYFIVKKEDKYYCFFPLLEKIIGDGFDNYLIKNNKTYIISNNKLYLIYRTGLRKSLIIKISNEIREKYIINYKNMVDTENIFAIRKKDDRIGLLDIKNSKFYDICDYDNFNINKIDNKNYKITFSNGNIIYNIKKHEILSRDVNYDSVLIFENNYKTISSNGKYILLDNYGNEIEKNDKQIILLNSKIIIGKVNNEFVLYDNDFIEGKLEIINNKNYYSYEKNGNKYLTSSDLKISYSSNKYIGVDNNIIVIEKDNELLFYDLKKDKEYSYKINDNNVNITKINRGCMVIYNNKNISIINTKGERIKKIKNSTVEKYFYDKKSGKIIIIVSKIENGIKSEGSYVIE